ncbi:MAG TPA: M14 family metallopeptidase [Myxococcota bacterium]|nr:M14 family metallopeptidase [Myxococcota bacterium]
MAYLNVDEVESALIAMAREWPTLCERIVLPKRSCEGRSISALRIGRLPEEEGDVLLISGCHHAREWGGADICVSLAADILEAYSRGTGLKYGGKSFSKAELARVVEGMHLVILPNVNPDGRHHSQTQDRLWRRNRNRSYAGGNPTCIGVDLNRNYDFLWDFRKHFHPKADVGTSDNPCDPQQTWRGPSPLSEPEVQNVDWLLRRYPRLRWYVDLHSYGELILTPWGSDEPQSDHPKMDFQNPLLDGKRGLPNDALYQEYIPAADARIYRQLAEGMASSIKAVRGRKYTPQSGFDLYPTSGCADDYAYSLHRVDNRLPKILAFTIEWGRKFQPAWPEMEQIIGEVSAGLLNLGLEGMRISGRVQITLKTNLLRIEKGEQRSLEFLIQTMRPLELRLDCPPGYEAADRKVPAAAGSRTVRIPIQSRTDRGGRLLVHCPQTGEEWEIQLRPF